MAVISFPILGTAVFCESRELVEVCSGLLTSTFKKRCIVAREPAPLVASCGLVADTFEKFVEGVENLLSVLYETKDLLATTSEKMYCKNFRAC